MIVEWILSILFLVLGFILMFVDPPVGIFIMFLASGTLPPYVKRAEIILGTTMALGIQVSVYLIALILIVITTP